MPRRAAASVAMIAGGVLLVIGIVALARASVRPLVEQGLNAATLYGGHVSVASLHFTRLGAIVAIAAGATLLFVGVGSGPQSGRETLRALGIAAIVWGVVLLPGTFHGTVGSHAGVGVLYVVVGAAVVVSTFAQPGRPRAR